ncbi:MAG: ATP-binding protein [Candidatus Marinimicrobia bacterium]|nr:ATP-binding protein [Candidatus Neomarinimicrobiota bacterium]
MVLVSLVTLIAALLMRDFFISNLESYQDQITDLSTNEKVREIHKSYSSILDSSELVVFNQDIEAVLIDLQKIEIAGDRYSLEIKRYSIGIVIIMIILTGSIFLLLLMIVTRPLTRLLLATEQLKGGDFNFQIKESVYSPLNGLIMAFNNMIFELNQSKERLIEAEKQTIWQEMARAMAHEIKNPLTPIRLAAQRLEMKYYEKAEDLPEILEKSLRIVNEEVDNLQSLVNAFSGFAKMPEAQFEYYDLNKQLRDISDQYSDDAKIDLILDESLNEIFADSMQMKQVLVNLIQNAIQACETEPHIEVSTSVQNQSCTIGIKDFGKGISEDDLVKIFEPYFTTKKKGTGLGLAITQRIIRQHGGDIKATSVLGKGSTFIISFPCNRENQQQITK